jgi:hypothetical protein
MSTYGYIQGCLNLCLERCVQWWLMAIHVCPCLLVTKLYRCVQNCLCLCYLVVLQVFPILGMEVCPLVVLKVHPLLSPNGVLIYVFIHMLINKFAVRTQLCS